MLQSIARFDGRWIHGLADRKESSATETFTVFVHNTLPLLCTKSSLRSVLQWIFSPCIRKAPSGSAPLMLAVSNSKECLKAILEYNPDLEAVDKMTTRQPSTVSV
jgi:hypothetical protein